VAEEVAWMAARFPGRVGVGVAAGSLDGDFAALGVPKAGLAARFAEGLHVVSNLLTGTAEGLLDGDVALQRCRDHPVPVLSAANSRTAARRAAACGTGLLFDSLSTPERCHQLALEYRSAGGAGPVVVVRRVWLGTPPVERQARQMDVYRSYTSAAAQDHWQGDQIVAGDDPDDLARRLAEAVAGAGADAVNIRVHVPGLDPGPVRDQIAALGEIIPPLRRTLDCIA
jgi:alkanesulfonate monooxygenase SsuD/methylene tetrahydromethanopterin reductase-like flavin-dependent oxidoreductase (luciferase family)